MEPVYKYFTGLIREGYDEIEECLDTTFQGLSMEEELAAMRQAFEESGMNGVWRLILEDRLKQPSPRPISVASLYARIGEKDLAFEWLEKTWSYPLMGYEVAPSSRNHDPLRDDPRFEELLRKLNLPEEAIQRHLAVAEGTP